MESEEKNLKNDDKAANKQGIGDLTKEYYKSKSYIK